MTGTIREVAYGILAVRNVEQVSRLEMVRRMEKKIVVIDGIVKGRDNRYNFSVRFTELKDAQFWKDIFNQVLMQTGVNTEIQNACYDEGDS